MTIIKEGNRMKATKWTTTCGFCGSEISWFEGDPLTSRVGYNCDSGESWSYWQCPVCGMINVAMHGNHITKEENAKTEKVILTLNERKELEGFADAPIDPSIKKVLDDMVNCGRNPMSDLEYINEYFNRKFR